MAPASGLAGMLPKMRGLKLLLIAGAAIAWSLLAAMLGAHTMAQQIQGQLDDTRRGLAELRRNVRRQSAGAAASASQAAGDAGVSFAGATPESAGLKIIDAKEVRRLAFTNLEAPWEASMGTGCVVLEGYSYSLTLNMLSCNMNRCPPCFVFNGSETSYAAASVIRLTLTRCSSMRLSNDVSLGSGRFANAVQRLDFINLVDQPATISDGITNYVLAPHTSAFGHCSVHGGDRIHMSGEGNLDVQRWAVKRLTAAGARWVMATSYPSFSARDKFAAFEAPDGKLWVDRGLDEYQSAQFDRYYSTDSFMPGSGYLSWSSGSSWNYGRYGHAIVALADGSLVLVGGMSSNCVVDCQDVLSSTDGVAWTTETSNSGITSRDQYFVVAEGLYVFVVAGRTASANPGFLSDVWMGMQHGASWTRRTENGGFGGRISHGLVARTDGALLVMGGMNSTHTLSDVWMSTDDGFTWYLLQAECGWGPRRGFGAVVRGDGHILVISGEDDSGGGYGDVWQSTTDGATWSVLTEDLNCPPRRGAVFVALRDGSIMMIGGEKYSALNAPRRLQEPNGSAVARGLQGPGTSSWTKTKEVLRSGEMDW